MPNKQILTAVTVCGLVGVAIHIVPHNDLIEQTAAAPAAQESVLVRNIPHVHQKPDFCGEACAEMALRHLGHRYDQDAVFDRAHLSPLEGRGCHTKELRTALTAIGFEVGSVWYKIRAAKVREGLTSQWNAVYRDLAAGVPSILCTRYDERPNTTEHFRLVIGYDATADEIIFHEPAEADGGYRRMPRGRLFELWPLKYDRDIWTVIRFPLKPNRIPAAHPTITFTDADYAQHMMQLKQRLPGDQFHVVLQKPFFVIGDEPAATVERRTAGTIRWAVEKLKQDYFARDPEHIIDIWLFKNKTSYDQHTESIFNDTPTTPYGYYSPMHRALVMNISTGGGTLVHEIVHPFIEANFPACPSWFNEGLASLYEQCGTRNKKIIGYTNWRLAGLQRAIRAGHVPSFNDLCSTTTREFYDDPRGTNYSQARYLCYYLQQQGKLRKYYHDFRKNAAEDPTGLRTLSTVLGEKDLDKFKKRWETYVAALKFR
ncbi:MAG: C39 family peptidase [Pirellulales bacterium]